MQESLLSQGLDLTIYGMGSVFVFLGLLIVMTTAVSKLVLRFFPEVPLAAPPNAWRPTSSQATEEVDQRTLQVIRTALVQHRARRSK